MGFESTDVLFYRWDTLEHTTELYLISLSLKTTKAAAKKLEKEPQDVTVLIKEEDYGSIVKQALAHYIADLSSRRQDITLGGELTEGITRVSSPYESEINTAENWDKSLKKKKPHLEI